MSDYIDELNDSQREAVLYNNGPALVIAGAGSGKTRVLTYKIAYLLENGYAPWNILALTFTNKASNEMKERIAAQVGQSCASRLWMGTFHSVFMRILHNESEVLGFSRHFTIYDENDSKSLISTIIKEMQLDDKTYKPNVIQNRISAAKNRLITPDDYLSSNDLMYADMKSTPPISETGHIYKRYCERCKMADAMDFDDLLLYTHLLFNSHPDILEKYQDFFKYVLVDEYQDTNYAQHKIVVQLAQRHNHICVVGDDAQSIYSFRGAEIDNILSFTKIFKDTKVFKLEQNYRSTQTIVNAANSLISKNMRQIRKNVFSEKECGDKIVVKQAYSDKEEGEIVIKNIAALRRNKRLPYSAFAILYRTNAQSRIFEEVLRKYSIPYVVYGGLSFYQRKEIKDIIAYFRLVVNPNDEEAFRRIVNYPQRGIGETTIKKLSMAAIQYKVSLWEVASHALEYRVDINKGTANKLGLFTNLIDSYRQRVNDTTAYELGIHIISTSGIIADVTQNNLPENISRKENIDELANGLNDFTQLHQEAGDEHILLGDYLSEVSLLTSQDNEKDPDIPKVTIMTAHSAKGLEFDTVFVVGMEEGLFPSQMADDSPRKIEEERRLFYVAITRAEKRCILTYSRTRLRYGRMEFGSPSRFLGDIDQQYMEGDGMYARSYQRSATTFQKPSSLFQKPSVSNDYNHRSFPQSSNQQPSRQEQRPFKRVGSTLTSVPSGSQTDNAANIHEGQRIAHERFGIGEVIKVEGSGENAKATIKFQNAGTRILLLRYAKITLLS